MLNYSYINNRTNIAFKGPKPHKAAGHKPTSPKGSSESPKEPGQQAEAERPPQSNKEKLFEDLEVGLTNAEALIGRLLIEQHTNREKLESLRGLVLGDVPRSSVSVQLPASAEYSSLFIAASEQREPSLHPHLMKTHLMRHWPTEFLKKEVANINDRLVNKSEAFKNIGEVGKCVAYLNTIVEDLEAAKVDKDKSKKRELKNKLTGGLIYLNKRIGSESDPVEPERGLITLDSLKEEMDKANAQMKKHDSWLGVVERAAYLGGSIALGLFATAEGAPFPIGPGVTGVGIATTTHARPIGKGVERVE